MWWLELDGVPPREGRPARILLRRDVPVTTIGRLQAATVVMMDPTLPQQYISRSHATITVRPRPLRPLLVNLSLNGTKGDTRALVRDESTDLYPGEAVVFGHRASATEYRYIVRHRDLAAMLGESHHYADFCLAHGASRPPPPVLVSTIKLRQAGFAGCIDTEAMFRELIRQAQDAKLLPPR